METIYKHEERATKYKKQVDENRKLAKKYQEQANWFLKLHNFTHFKKCETFYFNDHHIIFSFKDDKEKVLGKFEMTYINNKIVNVKIYTIETIVKETYTQKNSKNREITKYVKFIESPYCKLSVNIKEGVILIFMT
ncbi:hypothetical protein [Wolbachia endosymbiont of Pentidionis agamae]|uniref:hypothetical protein n=1 Tax=Wolbachia endosymbiont of Pentidionis agamae TaxID=3110435 RepID=UPI002FD53865